MPADKVARAEVRMPPQNIEAEEAVLGAMLINPNAIPVVTDVLDRDDFWRETHAIVFAAIKELYGSGREVDVVTVSAELERNGQLEKAGGREFVHALAEAVPAATAAAHYAGIVREQSMLRTLIQVGNEIAEMGYSHPDDVFETMDQAQQRLFGASESRTVEFRPLHDVVNLSIERLQASREDESAGGVKTGFDDLDAILTGLFPSNLIVLAARPSMGKTALALNIAQNAALEHGVASAIFSLEMSAVELGDRLLSSAAGVSTTKFRRPKYLSQKEIDKLLDVAGRLREAPIFIDESAGLTNFELRSRVRRLHQKHNLGLIIIDYLQLMVGEGRQESRQQEVAAISRSLKQLARELKVPVVAVSQLNRNPETRSVDDRIPKLADLRESGAIEQDADVVIFIHRELNTKDPEKKGLATVRVAKHRNGPVDDCRLAFVEEYTCFRTLARHD